MNTGWRRYWHEIRRIHKALKTILLHQVIKHPHWTGTGLTSPDLALIKSASKFKFKARGEMATLPICLPPPGWTHLRRSNVCMGSTCSVHCTYARRRSRPGYRRPGGLRGRVGPDQERRLLHGRLWPRETHAMSVSIHLPGYMIVTAVMARNDCYCCLNFLCRHRV